MRVRLAVWLLLILASPLQAQIPSLRGDIEQERRKYGATMTNDQCCELLNAVLWKNRDKGFALVEKTSGNHCTRKDGRKLSVDGIVWTADRTFIDALSDAGNGGKTRPAWQVHTIGEVNPETGNTYKPHTGPLVTPIDPGGSPPVPPTIPPPAPPTMPPPTPPEPCVLQVDPLGGVASVPADGWALVVTVTTPAHCAWSALSSEPWLQLSVVGEQHGPGQVRVSVVANTGTARSGEFVIAGQRTTVTQDAAPAPPSSRRRFWMLLLSLIAALAGAGVAVAQ